MDAMIHDPERLGAASRSNTLVTNGIPVRTGPMSTPRSSAIPATSFANSSRMARKTFDAFFTRLASSARITRSGVPDCESTPVTTAAGVRKQASPVDDQRVVGPRVGALVQQACGHAGARTSGRRPCPP